MHGSCYRQWVKPQHPLVYRLHLLNPFLSLQRLLTQRPHRFGLHIISSSCTWRILTRLLLKKKPREKKVPNGAHMINAQPASLKKKGKFSDKRPTIAIGRSTKWMQSSRQECRTFTAKFRTNKSVRLLLFRN